MRLPYECGYIAGRCDHPECGELAYGPSPQQPEPTEEEYCAANGHAYYGDHDGRGRCWCGHREYPVGGPS